MELGDDNEKIQELDYEGAPFQCRHYHFYGHLVKNFPMVQSVQVDEDNLLREDVGFPNGPPSLSGDSGFFFSVHRN